MVTTGLTLAPFPLTSRSNAEAKVLLAQTVSALKPDKAKTLDEIRKGESGFLDRDYPPRFNLSDGKNIAVASPNSKQVVGTDVRTMKDPAGKVFGPEPYAAALRPEGEVTEVNYMQLRPSSDKAPVAKTFVTQAGDLGAASVTINKLREPTYCPEHGEAVVRPDRAGAAFTWGKSRTGAQ
jgi:hypothetical protein